MAAKKKYILNVIPNYDEYEMDTYFNPVLEICLNRFIKSDDKEFAFPSSLTKHQRKLVHEFSAKHKLQTKSRGNKSFRYVTVYKKDSSNYINNDMCKVELNENSRTIISSLLQKYPVANKERQELLPPAERQQNVDGSDSCLSFGQLGTVKPQVPYKTNKSDISTETKSLPVWGLKNEIMSAINNNQVVLICGETGSGKTTQIPQMALEEASSLNRPCKLLCTQPRRISAISVSERVAAERGEKVGATVGYQIKLEGRTSSKTLLTYCTTGVILRALMGKNDTLSSFTHIYVDEVHERDKLMDFLLIALKESLATHPKLKVILMSANLDVDLYSNYFNTCPIVHVPVVMYPVKQYFLEDVLEFTNYRTPTMIDFINRSKITQNRSGLASIQNHKNDKPANGTSESILKSERCYSPTTTQQMDKYIDEGFLSGDDEIFSNILYFIVSEDVSPDYQHSTHGTTPLMVAAGRGRTDIIEVLLSRNASIDLKSSNGWTVNDWAASTNQSQVLEMIEAHRQLNGTVKMLDKLSCKDDQKASEEKTLIANAYTSSVKEDDCDKNLLFAVIAKIHCSEPPGGILVFLTGYEDIVYLRDRILADDKVFNRGKDTAIFCLHSSMQSADQKRVFDSVPNGVRKIVLATNIAETSVTINDIIYIVDCAMHKQMSYDALTSCSSLRTVKISQASVNQRRGRAGRCQPGIAYHLISEEAFRRLQPHETPEILRTPLQDLCLQSKFLSPPNMSIADFLSKAPQAPSTLSLTKAVNILKKMGALDAWEDVTELGHRLFELSLPPHLGKMVLMACILKCLDPVLTIAAFLSYKDPFVLPANQVDRMNSKLCRKKFGSNMFSDHYLLFSIYESYETACNNNYQNIWCKENFISASTMELVSKIRRQILAQLQNSGFLKVKFSTDLREVNTNMDNWPLVKAAILSGMYPSLLKLDRLQMNFQLESYNRLRLHRYCALIESVDNGDISAYSNTMKKICKAVRTNWFFYDELCSSSYQAIVRKVTPVSDLTVLLFSGPMRLPLDALTQPLQKKLVNVQKGSDSEDEVSEGTNCSIALDSWVNFTADQTTSCLLLQFRHKIQSLVLRKLKSPFKPATTADDEIIQVLATLLKKQDKELGLLPKEFETRNNIQKLNQPIYTRFLPNSGRPPSNESNPRFAYSNGRQRDADYNAKPCESIANVSTTNTITLSASKPVACSDSAVKTGVVHHAKDINGKNNSAENKTETSYFIVRFPSFRQIEICQNLGSITFSLGTERKLLAAVQKKPVTLIFALNRGKQFFGYAKFNGRLSERRQYPEFSNVEHINQVFKVHFIRSNVFFHQTRHLLNSFNENLQIHMCRDGQEVEKNVGEELMKILERAVVPGSVGNAYMNDSMPLPRRQFLQHHYAPRPPPPFMPHHRGPRPDFAGPYTRPFRGYGFGGGFRGVHRGYRRGFGHS